MARSLGFEQTRITMWLALYTCCAAMSAQAAPVCDKLELLHGTVGTALEDGPTRWPPCEDLEDKIPRLPDLMVVRWQRLSLKPGAGPVAYLWRRGCAVRRRRCNLAAQPKKTSCASQGTRPGQLETRRARTVPP